MFALIEDQQQSGLTVKTFCEQRGIAVHSYYWNKKYRNNNKPASDNGATFTRLQIEDEVPGHLFCKLI